MSRSEFDTKDMKAICESVPTKTIFQAIATLEGYIELAIDYAESFDALNAFRVLDIITAPFVSCVTSEENKKKFPEEETEDRTSLDSFVASLEDAWTKSCTKLTICDGPVAAPIRDLDNPEPADIQAVSKEQMEARFASLAQWRMQLTPVLGPIFSDALRALKKQIQKSTQTPVVKQFIGGSSSSNGVEVKQFIGNTHTTDNTKTSSGESEPARTVSGNKHKRDDKIEKTATAEGSARNIKKTKTTIL
jgi:hypothetical protein